MARDELAYTSTDPVLAFWVATEASDAARSEFESALARVREGDGGASAAAALIALADRLPTLDPSFGQPTVAAVNRHGLEHLAARQFRSVDERPEVIRLLSAAVDGLTAVDAADVDGGLAQLARLKLLAARFELFWLRAVEDPHDFEDGRPLDRIFDDLERSVASDVVTTAAALGMLNGWVTWLEALGLAPGVIRVRARISALAARHLGERDPVTLACRYLEADLLETSGELGDAWRCFERLVRDLARSDEGGGLVALQIRSGHAFLAGRRGSPKRAIRLYRELLADLDAGRFTGDSVGPFDADLPREGTGYLSGRNLVRMNLATWLRQTGQFEEAAPLLDAVVGDSALLAVAADHPTEAAATMLQAAQHDLGTVLRDLGRHDESVPVFRALLAGRLGPAEPDAERVEDARRHLVEALLRTGDHEGAQAVGQALLAQRVAERGHDDPWTLLAAVQLAAVGHGLGEDDALAHLRSLTDVLIAAVGPVEDRSLYARLLLQAAAAADGDPDAAAMATRNLQDCRRHFARTSRFVRDAERAAGLS